MKIKNPQRGESSGSHSRESGNLQNGIAKAAEPKRKPREDFVRFRLKKSAPDFVAFGGRRFHGVYRRADEPFEATAGEWKVFLEKTGRFELETAAAKPAALKAPDPKEIERGA